MYGRRKRNREGFLFRFLMLPLLLSLFISIPIDSAADAPFAWERLASSGVENPADSAAGAMVSYAGKLFLGTYNANGCRVWSYDGVAWYPEVGADESGTPTGPGFGLTSNVNVSAMVVYRSRLYVSVRNMARGCSIWSFDGTSWRQEVGQGTSGTPTGPGFGDQKNTDVPSMAVFKGRLYAGTYNAEGFQVWSYDGNTWLRIASGGLGDADNYGVSSMAVYYDRLYAGTYNNDYSSGCQIWSYDGISWRQEVGQGASGTPTGPGFGDPKNRKAASMTVYNAGLYVGTYDSSGGEGCEVWAYDGANWTKVSADGFGTPSNLGAVAMAAGGLDLYVGTFNEASGCEVWKYDGSNWHRTGAGGFGYADNTSATSLVLQGEGLVVATQNLSGFQVWRTRSCQTLYFAEGYTGNGFQEYLCLANRHPIPVRTSVTYLFPDGSSLSRILLLPAESRLTIHVNLDVGPNREVAVQLESEADILAERPMYFNYVGKWAGGHSVVGAESASCVWYFAEGYTGDGFDEWICVLNPMESDASLDLYFQTQEEGVVERTGLVVPARSRRSFNVDDLLGTGYQASLKLISTVPVVAERPMYFDYRGTAGYHWQGGHCVMGATQLSHMYYFPEGTTRSGFDEWLTIQNPNPFNIMVYASFQPGPDQGAVVERTYIVRAGRRYTVYVPGEVGRDKDVSTVLVSTALFLAERPMYYNYSGVWTGGDCVVGATAAGKEWLLAEGYTGAGFHTWLCLHNPGSEDVFVAVYYYTQEVGALRPRTLMVPPRTRHTVFVNDDAGPCYQLSIRVLSDRPIVVERPIYFDYAGIRGGHTAVGSRY